jgi:hypothetical protein
MRNYSIDGRAEADVCVCVRSNDLIAMYMSECMYLPLHRSEAWAGKEVDFCRLLQSQRHYDKDMKRYHRDL